jgi:hypothetical protein
MSGQSIFEAIKSELYQIISQDLRDKKEVDRLYLENKFHPFTITAEVPSAQNIDFDYAQLRFVSEGSYTNQGNGIHVFHGIHWKLPYRLIKDGHQTFFNGTRGEIGGIVEVIFDRTTAEPETKVNRIEQTVYAHPN